MSRHLTIEFFHDVVCCWCFNISSRMRVLAEEFDLHIRHRTFILQASREEMAARWGTPAQARKTILDHWAACKLASDHPELIATEAMRKADFDYPHGGVAALACKAAELIGGQAAHWAMFDRIQAAHITEARNVADTGVLAQLARDLGMEGQAFGKAMAHPSVAAALETDRRMARRMQVASIPALIIRETGTRLVNGPVEDLRAQLRAAERLVSPA